jgi:hypothetical protein
MIHKVYLFIKTFKKTKPVSLYITIVYKENKKITTINNDFNKIQKHFELNSDIQLVPNNTFGQQHLNQNIL